MKKISEEYVKQYLIDNGGWQLLSHYTGTHDNLTIERDGYKSITSFTSFKSGHKPIIFGVKNPFYKNNICELIYRKDERVQFVDAKCVKKSGKHRIVVDMIDANGHSFSKTIEHILNNEECLCCKECARKIQTKRHRKSFTNKWISRIDSSRYSIISEIDYLTADSFIDIEDVKTGYRIHTNIRAASKNPQAFNVFSNEKFFLYNLSIYGENNGLSSTPVSIVDKSATHTKVLFRCSCGNEFVRSVYKWMDGRDRCATCSQTQSSYEKRFEEYLIQNSIKYKSEYRFNACKDIKPLPFDFYLPQYDCLIEIDGIQHFEPIAFSGDKKDAERRFELQKKHDKLKQTYCNDNNIPLLRIPYTWFDDETWKEKFNHFIKPLRINDP